MAEVSDLIEQILWDRRYVDVPDDISAPVKCVIIKDPNVSERNIYSAEKRRLFREAVAAGNPTEDELMDQAKTSGSWTEKQDLEYEALDDHIAYLQGEIARQSLKSRKKKLQNQIDEASEKRDGLRLFRAQITRHSAEYFAHEASVMKMIRMVILDLNNNQLWTDDKTYLADKQEYPVFFAFLADSLLSYGTMETVDYRRVARAMEWRVLWMSQRENLHGLFGRPACDLTIRQTLLIYWSRVYDQVFEDPKKPDDDVIEDDDKLDAWFANRTLEQNELKSEKRSNKKHKTAGDHHERIQVLDGEYIDECTCGALAEKGPGLGMSRRHDDTCPWGTWRYFTAEEKEELANRFYGRNAKPIRSLINKEMEIVADKEFIEEQDLRNKRSRMILGSQHKVTPIKR